MYSIVYSLDDSQPLNSNTVGHESGVMEYICQNMTRFVCELLQEI